MGRSIGSRLGSGLTKTLAIGAPLALGLSYVLPKVHNFVWKYTQIVSPEGKQYLTGLGNVVEVVTRAGVTGFHDGAIVLGAFGLAKWANRKIDESFNIFPGGLPGGYGGVPQNLPQLTGIPEGEDV